MSESTDRENDRPTLRLGHSPDPDDAFMWWPLLERDGAPPALDLGRFRFEAVLDDIESLNHRSGAGELEITAMSCAQYPFVQGRYALTACGASLGEGYGPKLVSADESGAAAIMAGMGVESPVIAVPGERTSAFAVLSLMLGPGAFRYAVVPFDEIIGRVAAGEYAAGLVIHEGQLTFSDAGLHLVADLGAWWTDRWSLPIPLGVNAIRRDLENEYGPGTLAEVTQTLRRSVDYALEHREASIRYAIDFARDVEADRADEFVRMYVNGWTLDFGVTGRSAVGTLFRELEAAGLTPPVAEIDFIAVDAASC